ncbi:MAG: ATP-binding cassette domain-containing protein [Flavobacteriales bacterium]
MSLITVNNLKKNFDNIQALKGVNFEVEKGEVFGLLGPNGAGKTTTLNILNTLMKQDEGEISVDGVNPIDQADEYRKKIGVVPQELSLYHELSAFDNLKFWGNLYGLSN